MTNIYSALVTANFTANIDTLAIELDAPANTTIKIRKIRVTTDDGTGLTVDDAHREITFITESVAGTGGSTFTPIDQDDNDSISVTTVKTVLATVGTIATTIDRLSVHSGTDFFWQAADEDDKIVILPGGIFGVVINPAG